MALGVFPKLWKIANIVPIHKKGSVHDPKMYRPVSLLPCVSKVFEKLMFNTVYLHLRRNGLISEFQSGFTPGDSTINQLIHINDHILKSLSNLEDVIGCFLDLTRAFDTVWHKGLLYKLEKYGIRDHTFGSKTLTWFSSYLANRGHRVAIDGKTSNLEYINAAVPQGSVLGPLLFLVYINDVTDGIESEIFLFADDTSIFRSGKCNESLAQQINSDLNKISLWAKRWKININPTKTVAMLFSKKASPDTHFQIKLNNEVIRLSSHHKHLGLWLTDNMTWKKHITEISSKARQRLGCLKRHIFRMSRKSLEICYLTFIRPVLEYGNVLYDAANEEDLNVLDDIEKEAMRVITGARKRCNIDALYNEFKWPCLAQRRINQKITTLGKIVIKQFPNYLVNDLPTFYKDSRSTRINTFATPTIKKDYYQKSFVPSSIALWNDQPLHIRCAPSYDSLKARVKRMHEKIVPPYYYFGERWVNIMHTRLRLGCSILNYDKHKIGISDTDRCECGERETAYHFLLDCGIDLRKRIRMLDSVMDVLLGNNRTEADIDEINNINLYLRGSPRLTLNENTRIFKAVHIFLEDTGRFA